MMARCQKVDHPGWDCCEKPPEDVQAWIFRSRIALAQLREQVRNLRAAADIAHAEDLRLCGVAYRQEIQQGRANLAQQSEKLAYALQGHRLRLCGMANAIAQRCMNISSHLDRIERAHAWRWS